MKRNPIFALLALFMVCMVGRAQAQVLVWGDNFYGQTNVPASATNVIALAAGDSHCLALRRDGTVVAWGGNSSGQTNVPADITNVVSIAAGSTHALALRRDGTIALWGKILPSNATNVPPAATNVVSLALGPGAQHCLVLRGDGTVVDWGNDSYGLTNIPPTAVNIVSVAAGATHSLALRADGKVVVWGDNTFGQLNVPAAATNIVAIAVGWHDNAALRADGAILVWGTLSAPPPSAGFTNLVDLARPFNSSFGANSLLGLRRDGTLALSGSAIPTYATNQIAVIAAGSNDGLVAVGSGAPVFPGLPANRTVPGGARAYFRGNAVGALPLFYQWNCNGTNIPGATNTVLTLTDVQADMAGNSYTLVATNSLDAATNGPMILGVEPSEVSIKATNTSAVVGATLTFTASTIGQGPFNYQWFLNGTNLLTATNSLLTLTNVQLADAGMYSLVVSNSFGFVTNAVSLSVAPTIVTARPQNQSSFPGGTTTFSLTLQAIIPVSYQWQFNGTDLPGATGNSLTLTNIQYQQAGIYSLIFSNEFEIQTNIAALTVSLVAGWGDNRSGQLLIPALTNVVAIASGGFHGLALKSDGSVTAWGSNNFGQTNVPPDLTNVIAIAAGGFHSLALKRDGTVVAWGRNDYGQATPPLDLVDVVAIAGGDRHSLALKSDGHLVLWGYSALGLTNVPANLTNAVAIAGGYAFNLVLKSDGTLLAWGANNSGQTNVPPDLTNVVAISAGSFHSVATTSDGRIVSWGDYNDGKTNVPAGLSNAAAISGGFEDSVVLTQNGTVVAWGRNSYNQTNVPTGLTNVVAVAAGYYHNLALISQGPPITGVSLLNPAWSNSVFSVSAPSQSGHVYRLEYKNSLDDTDWTALPLAPGNGGLLRLTDPAPNSPERFYRVRKW
jgi:alpha-tubulin suppressor-like RCC1 family protein